VLRDFDLRYLIHLGLAIDGYASPFGVVLLMAQLTSRPPRVLNASRVGLCVVGAALVDRTTLYGNPFRVGVDGVRGECVQKFEKWILKPEQAWLVAMAKRELRGKHLICWCNTPRQKCHASVWLRIVNG